MSTLARRQLRLLMLEVVQYLTGVKVSSPGDWESTTADLPDIRLRNRQERKVSGARSAPTFTTTVTLELLARVQGDTAEAAQDELEALGASIEDAVMAAPALIKQLQQIAGVNTQTNISAEGRRHVGEIMMQIDCEVFESFDPVEIDPGKFPELQQLLINVDTLRPFDPGSSTVDVPANVDDDVGDALLTQTASAGTEYPNPAYPDSVQPAPRNSGRDGRNEGTLLINLSATP